MRLLKLIFLAFICSFQTIQAQEIVDEYIGAFQFIAISEMERTGIPASIKLAQGLLESNWGRSELSLHAHNHFGIKCGGSWEGNNYYRFDDDYDHTGKLKKSCFRVFDSDDASYIAHSEFLLDNQRYSFLFDYSSTDHKAWAKGLRKAGYATDPSYPAKLIGIIKKYDLARFDYMAADELELLAEATNKNSDLTEEERFAMEAMEDFQEEETEIASSRMDSNAGKSKKSTKPRSADEIFDNLRNKAEALWNKQSKKRQEGSKSNFNFDQLLAEVKALGEEILNIDKPEEITSTPDIEHNNEVKITLSENGETLQNIANRMNVSIESLIEFNDNAYTATQPLHRGTTIYTEAKKTLYDGDANSHYVQGRETVLEIAQKYGLTVASVRNRNYLSKGEEVKHGEILYLRGIRTSRKPKTRTVKKKKEDNYLFESTSK